MRRLLTKRSVLLCLLLLASGPGAGQGAPRKGTRSIQGIVYFTNNAPEDHTFMVELFEERARRRVAARWTNEHGEFEFKDLRAGVYYVQVSGANICLLQYEVNASKRNPERMRIFGDADCGKSSVKGLPAPRPVPRPNKR